MIQGPLASREDPLRNFRFLPGFLRKPWIPASAGMTGEIVWGDGNSSYSLAPSGGEALGGGELRWLSIGGKSDSDRASQPSREKDWKGIDCSREWPGTRFVEQWPDPAGNPIPVAWYLIRG